MTRLWAEIPVRTSDEADEVVNFIPMPGVAEVVRNAAPATPKYGEPLEDGSQELIEWLNSVEGRFWSKAKHKAVTPHALVEDIDDHRPGCDCVNGGYPRWDNSMFEMLHRGGVTDVQATILPIPFDPDYVF